MSLPSVSITIRAGSDGLPTLNLTPANGYYLDFEGLALEGDEVWSREYAESRYVSGSALISARRDHQTGTLFIYVEGDSVAEVWSRINTLRSAVRQFNYKIDVTIDGTVTETYDCDPADTSIGDSGVIKPLELAASKPGLMVRLTVPHKP